jgi:PAS domain S-box-containing protein
MQHLIKDIEADLKLILESISAAVLFESEKREIIYVNRNFCNLFSIQVEPELMTGADCKNAAREARHFFKSPQYFMNLVEQILTKALPMYNEELILADGRSVFLDYIPVKRDDSLEHAHLWIYKNINEINHFVESANYQKQLYESLLNNIPADIAIFDHHHKYLFVNKNAIQNEEKRSWVIGRDDFEYCTRFNKDTDGASLRRNAFIKALQTKSTVEFEETNYDVNHQPIYNLRRFFPVIKSDGEIHHIIGYGINITSIKLHEQNLLAREKEFKSLIDSMDQMVVSVDDELAVHYCNPKWIKVTGIKSTDCKGKKLGDFLRLNRGSFEKVLMSFIQNGKYQKGNRRAYLIDHNGEKKIVNYYISHFVDNLTRSNRYAIFMTDITDQILAEAKLKKIAKQERKLNELKSNFMNMVSHELRTPLSVILSSTELIELKLNKDNHYNSHLSTYTERIIAQVDRMSQLMNDFLFISKVEAGKISVKPILINPEQFLQTIIEELYHPWKDGRSMQLSIKGTAFDIQVDEMMLRHIVINIINNAFKYSIGMPAPIARLIFTPKLFQLLVIDQGIGIHKEDARNLFSPFVRGSNVGDVEGTGLGLLVVKYFVELHMGTVEIKSTPNKGTAVLISFPIK